MYCRSIQKVLFDVDGVLSDDSLCIGADYLYNVKQLNEIFNNNLSE